MTKVKDEKDLYGYLKEFTRITGDIINPIKEEWEEKGTKETTKRTKGTKRTKKT